MFSKWKTQLRNWRSEAHEWRAAWAGQDAAGDDGLTPFQRSAVAALSTVVGDVVLLRCGNRETYLRCDLPGSATFLLVYEDGVEVHGAHPWTAECQDYRTPAELIDRMLVAVRANRADMSLT